MKNLMKKIGYVALIGIVSILSSCQDEFEEVNGNDEQQTIQANSTTASLIEKTTAFDGSYDDVVDESSCFALKFPYTISINGTAAITITSMEDLQGIKVTLAGLDNGALEISFPVTITLSDHSEIVVENREQLLELARDCVESATDNKIRCIDFVYPITLFTFNVDNQMTGEVMVESDMQMRRFFSELEDNELVSISFPITLKKSDGTEIIVENNTDLHSILSTAGNECDRNTLNKEILDAFLLACQLEVREVLRDNVDSTDQYFESIMTFSQDGTVVIGGGTSAPLTGTWTTQNTDSGVQLTLDFNALVDFSMTWDVYEWEPGVIKLYRDAGNRIILKKRCDVDPVEEIDPDTLRAILNECNWVIKKVKNQEEEVRRLLGYEFQFMADGTVTLSNGTNLSEGTWEIGLNNQLQLSVMISMSNEPEVSFEWPLRELTDTRLKFEVFGTDHEMTLLRVCNDNADDGDVVEIRDIAMDGPWNIALYKEAEVDLTTSFAGMEFNFSTMNQIEVSVNQDFIATGLWRVLRDTEEGLKCYLNFDTDGDLLELTDDWKVVSITSTRIELKDDSEEGNLKTLVFEKS
ncbi:hypothetical protein [Flagellimonas hadalis]|uniref:Lipocalin-like domain-containing protein n=1 Tax=Flagellimonas hadalis TaxID=2597517 RepID=A0A5N5IQV4_9FLAO|nr:hypothetical protein [Allomuricauda hadalis]KAB5484734.1 hypothetical protein FOT42_016215 [Allomuricauda hadalis]